MPAVSASTSQIDPEILRASDIRGVVGKNLTPDIVERIGRAFATMLRHEGGKTVAVGYDGRHSSPALEAALVQGLRASGADVIRVGCGPSPMLYFAIHHLSADAGMMITGSHNPKDHNGIKMMMLGRSLHGEDIRALGTLADSGPLFDGNGTAGDTHVADAYLDRLLQGQDQISPYAIAWDAGNGAAGQIMEALSRRLPGRHHLLNQRIDGSFPAHHPDPTVEKNLEQLRETVLENGCDLGIAFDGDGDRIGIIDNTGKTVWADQLMCLFVRDVLADQPGANIIADVKCSQVLFDEIRRHGGTPVMWKSGHAMIKSKMAETRAPLAGEMSAHLFFAHNYYGFDDALYAAVRLIAILSRTGRSLSDLLGDLPDMVNTPELRFDCPEDRKFQVIEEVATRLSDQTGIEVNRVDGVRVCTPDGWWLLRASNTQAMLVARLESSTEAGLVQLKVEVSRQLTLSGLSLPE